MLGIMKDMPSMVRGKIHIMADSEKPLFEKLGLRPGGRVCIINHPSNYSESLGALPFAIVLVPGLYGMFDFIHFFVTNKKELADRFHELKTHLEKNGSLWISWPKSQNKTKIATDLNENIIREIGLKVGLVDVKVVAIDDTWSGLKFIYRLGDR